MVYTKGLMWNHNYCINCNISHLIAYYEKQIIYYHVQIVEGCFTFVLHVNVALSVDIAS